MDAPRPNSDPSDEKVLRRCLQNPTLIYSSKAEQRLDALVARVTDLEAQLAKAEGWKARAEELEADYRERAVAAEAQVEDWAQRFAALSVEHTQALRDADAAEAQVAALTQEREMGRASRDQWQREAEGRGRVQYELLARAEAAEAALAEARQALTAIADGSWNIPGPGHHTVSSFARRALAATDTTNAT